MPHVLITGATRGLGRALADGFAARGWTVTGCGRDRRALDELAAALPAPHRFLPCEVTDPAAVGAFADGILASHGAPDLLLNNAATINRSAPLWELEPAEFATVIDVNLKGVFHLCRAFLPAMIERGSGVLVNFSSGWGRSTSPEVAPYCGSKWGIEGLTRSLAQELPPGLAAVPFNPGIIDTDMLRSCFGAGASSYPDPRAWARTAVPFLAGLGPRHNGEPLTAPG